MAWFFLFKKCLISVLVSVLLNDIADDFKVERYELNNFSLIKLTLNFKDSNYITYTSGQALKPFTSLSADQKIRLIEELLKFENDTSICYNKVYSFWPQYYRGKYPISVQYELQVEALHMINFIAFTDVSYSYAPFPILFDKRKKREIYGHSKDLTDIFNLYKSWFVKIKKIGFVNYGFPLINSKYKWFGGIDREVTFKSYPAWRKDAAGDIK